MISVTTTLAAFDADQLHEEISDLDIDEFEHIATDGDQVSAVFNMISMDQTMQDAVLATLNAHVPTGNLDVKLYRYIESWYGSKHDPPFCTDFITGINARLHPTNSIIVDGEIREVSYYASASPPNAQGVVTYSDLVIRETFTYTRDAMGFARARTHTITWYREDGTPHPQTKTRVKYYENDESLREGQRRRRNITDTLSMNVTGWLVATQTQHPTAQARIQMGRDFMAHHKIAFDMYADASDASILYDVRDDVEAAHTWLDSNIAEGVTVRAYILDALNIWNLTL